MTAIGWLEDAARSYQAQTGAIPSRVAVGEEFLDLLADEVAASGLPNKQGGAPWTRADVIQAARDGSLVVRGVRVEVAA